MRNIIFILTILVSVSVFAQEDSLVKTDGTKYYLQIYDGETNEKVLYHNTAHSAWQTKIQVADYFDGSQSQLWSFTATEMFPGYFSVKNHDGEMEGTHSLMSWNWLAYMAQNADRDPNTDMEMQFRFVEAFNGYYILETIEKPTDGSLYGIEYTPGADAFNLKDGAASFSDVKSADITQENMANKVFKLVEFNPMELFEESIERGDNLYNDNPNAPEGVLFDLFYTIEKAREVRVFGTEAEMLAFQPVVDSVLTLFNQSIGLSTAISDARSFIDTSVVDSDVKVSFNAIVDDAEDFLFEDDLDYSEIDSVLTRIDDAQLVVEAIIAANTYGDSLAGQDVRLVEGLTVSIDTVKAVLEDLSSESSDYSSALAILATTQDIIDQIIIATELIASTQEFEEAKATLDLAVEQAITDINTAGNSQAEMDQILLDIKDAVKTFQKALEAGDTPLELINADFENDLTDWNVDSPTPGSAYPENKGVDGSRSITFWKGSAYQMKVFQSLSDIPNGTYQIKCYANVNMDSTIALFAESGVNTSTLPLANEGGLTERIIEIQVENGLLEFGIRGNGVDNAIPAGNWVVFDEFEIKWKASVAVENYDFENEMTGWTSDATAGVPYLENKGVDGSRSVTCWKGSAYFVKVSQTISGLSNGTYAVSAMTIAQIDSTFTVFGTSGDSTFTNYVLNTAELTKFKVLVDVTDGTLEFGIKGAGAGNTVPAGRWIVFDNVEILRLPDVSIVNSGFDSDLADWIVESPTPEAAYAQDRGIDASRSITWWRGSAYQMKVYQSISSIYNGTYKVSCVYRNSQDVSIGLFAESGVNSVDFPLPLYNNGEFDLTKADIDIIVADGTLSFGIRGQGDNNEVPAGNWIIYDEFAVLVKSIIPTYVVVPPVKKSITNNLDGQEIENKVIYWQGSQSLNIRSTNPIVRYSVYSISGSMIDSQRTQTDLLNIPLKTGIYVVKVLTENGFIDTEKVIIL